MMFVAMRLNEISKSVSIARREQKSEDCTLGYSSIRRVS